MRAVSASVIVVMRTVMMAPFIEGQQAALGSNSSNGRAAHDRVDVVFVGSPL